MPNARPPALCLSHALAWAAAIAGPLVLYLLTLPHTVVLEDDGLFLMVGAHLGIAHPPGYPLYTWICHAFMQLPFGSPAFLGHLSSAVLGALACGFVYWGARLLGASALPALFAAWLFGASEHFWSQAIIAEVYTLNALLFFAAYALLLHGARDPNRAWPWLCAAAAYGLSLANHWPLMGLATPGLMLAALPAWRIAMRRLPGMFGVALPCAALPYAWMVWRSQQNPLISFYGPIENWDRFWFYLSRQGYAGIDASPSAGWADRLDFLQWLGHEMVWQLTLPGFLLALLGLLTLCRRRQLAAAGSGLLVFAGNSLVLILLLNFDFEFFRVAIFRPYPLVCFGLLALWLAVGFQCLTDALPRRASKLRLPEPWLKLGTAGLAGCLMVGSSVHAHWALNDRSGSDFTEHFAAMALDRLPPNAALFTTDDAEAFPLGYYHFVEQRRPDILKLDLLGHIYSNRLYDSFIAVERQQKILKQFIARSERPVFSSLNYNKHVFPKERHGRISGFLMRLDPGDGGDRFVRNPDAEQYFIHLMNARYVDRWERFWQSSLIHQYCRYLGYVKILNDPDMLEPMQPLYDQIGRSYSCMTGIASVLLEFGGPADRAPVEAWLKAAEPLRHEALTKASLANLYYLKGHLAETHGRRSAAMRLYRKSLAVRPHPDNKAGPAIIRLRRTKQHMPPGSNPLLP